MAKSMMHSGFVSTLLGIGLGTVCAPVMAQAVVQTITQSETRSMAQMAQFAPLEPLPSDDSRSDDFRFNGAPDASEQEAPDAEPFEPETSEPDTSEPEAFEREVLPLPSPSTASPITPLPPQPTTVPPRPFPPAASTIFENVTLSPGFTPTPATVRGISGGATPANELTGRAETITGACDGFIDQQPDHRMVLTQFFNFLSLEIQSTENTTLVIRGPGGTWCNDDYSGKNPGIAGQWLSGTYEIWIGSFEQNTYHPYVIEMSEQQ